MLQAGSAAVGQGLLLLPPRLPSHFTHAPAVEQTGAVRTGHSVGSLLAAHSTHTSFLQYGFPATPAHSRLGTSSLFWSAQATQRPAALQTGVGAAHWALLAQPEAQT